MSVSRAGKLFFGAFFVGTVFLFNAHSFALAQDSATENTEALSPTPAAEEHEPIAHENYGSEIINESCGDNVCSFEGVPLCSPPGRIWVRSDWLMWWTSGSDLPPLVTTSPQGTPQDQAGVLGQQGTSVLFGDSTVYNTSRSGVRLTLGAWLDNCHRWGVEGDWLTLGGNSINYANTSTGNPILARPFFNVQTNAQDSQLKAYPGVVTGSVDVIGNDYFDSAGVALRYNLCCNTLCGSSCGDVCENQCSGIDECGNCDSRYLNYCRTDLLIGYRYYVLGDNLSIGEDIFDTATQSRFQINDYFTTRNEFHGAEIGLNTELRRNRWSLGLLAKMAMGNSRTTTSINGITTITNSGGQTVTYADGIYAVQSNSGVYVKDQFVVIPHLAAELGYQLTCRLRAFVGYDLLFWAPVMRAGEQIDLNVDPRNFPPVVPGGLPFPAYHATQTNFWAQGINMGAEFRF